MKRSMKFALAFGLLAAIAAPALLAQEKEGDKKASGIPMRKVVMFNSGVAFFEHGGEVEGNAQVNFKFNVEDVNDLLKSMVLQDLGGGKISTVNYGSRDPITKTLKTFAIDLTTNPTLADLLAQVRGEKVQVDAPNAITGTIVGVEKRKQPVKDGEPIEVSYLNLLTDDGLRSISLETVGKIKLLNPQLDGELRQALTILAMGHDVDKKTVSLNFLGDGKRQVRVGYIQEAPIWKTSYRLVLKDDDKPLLQGWAIVENTTEEDWKDVNLTLVSGRPISFIMDLYRPLYLDRPEVVPELFASLRPQTYDQDLAGRDVDFRRAADMAEKAKLAQESLRARRGDGKAEGSARGFGGGGGGGFFGGAPGAAAPAADRPSEQPFNIGQGVQSAAQAENVGELFQYAIDSPVTLPRQQSAMLPIVNGAVEADKVSIYNPGVHVKHPLNGLQFTNTTGLHLMQGPITVFDDNAYAGDAQIQDLQPGTKRLISYAMDLGTEVAQTANPQTQSLMSLKLVKGVMHTSYKHQRHHAYTVKNSGQKKKKVLVEYAKDPAWTLTGTKPTETTRDLYRFTVDAEPGKPAEVKIDEEMTVAQQIALNNMDDNTIRFFISQKIVSEKIKEALAEVIRRKQAISEVAAERTRLQQQITVIDQEQARIRQNMAQLDRVSDLYQRYVKKLTEQEDTVDSLRKKIEGLVLDEQGKRTDLDKYLIGLTLE
ncbi:MAG: DUF4139 domain-containing protein [Planctomycetia bacterium]|nr:DUF4139 domain-containing protein [Planctomycetia bacterium]